MPMKLRLTPSSHPLTGIRQSTSNIRVFIRDRQLKPPKPYIKKIVKQDIPKEKVFGRDAFDEERKNHNRVKEWSFIQKT